MFGNKYNFRSISMEIILGAIVLAGALYYIWSKSNGAKVAEQKEEAPYKVEAPATVTVVAGDIAFVAPAEPEAVIKPAKKARTSKPKAVKTESKPKVDSKPKAPRKPKMKVAK